MLHQKDSQREGQCDRHGRHTPPDLRNPRAGDISSVTDNVAISRCLSSSSDLFLAVQP